MPKQWTRGRFFEALNRRPRLAITHRTGLCPGVARRFLVLVAGQSVNTVRVRPALHTLLRGTAAEQHPENTAAVRDA